ncbi:hypothetical protein BX283_1755 [Streptomyces sp. TLI_146]|nr:hypothetical protein BX283_1755 [Streptomyces sp. TLI_146]
MPVDPAVTTTQSVDLTAFTVAGRSYPLDAQYGNRQPRGFLLHVERGRCTPTAAMRRAAALYHEQRQGDCGSPASPTPDQPAPTPNSKTS